MAASFAAISSSILSQVNWPSVDRIAAIGEADLFPPQAVKVAAKISAR
jgi:hypothetical protein